MHKLTSWLVGAFLSPLGLLVLGVLDGSMFVATPFALDATVLVLVAHHPHKAWMYPLIATAGSIAGVASTFWIGRKIGEAGLSRYLSRRQIDRTLPHMRDRGAIAIALLDLVPPPFPFTPFVLVAGALDVKASRFLIAVAIVKYMRFGLEAGLALIYGRQIVAWMESDFAEAAGSAITLVIVGLMVYSMTKLLRLRVQPRSA
jgi:membrane protein YqaA with SNARE-associated domain